MVTQLNLPRVFVRHLSILGSTTGNADEFGDLVVAAGRGLKPVVAREYPLTEVREALDDVERSARVGKVVLNCVS
jgi:zinc-binding alcohol dehydrogenase/oxidoreductase